LQQFGQKKAFPKYCMFTKLAGSSTWHAQVGKRGMEWKGERRKKERRKESRCRQNTIAGKKGGGGCYISAAAAAAAIKFMLN
jgi:hypothetical protein